MISIRYIIFFCFIAICCEFYGQPYLAYSKQGNTHLTYIHQNVKKKVKSKAAEQESLPLDGDSCGKNYDFQKNLSNAVEIVARENETTESVILSLSVLVAIVTILSPIAFAWFQYKNNKFSKMEIKNEMEKKKNELERSVEKKIMELSKKQKNILPALVIDKLMPDVEKKILDEVTKNISTIERDLCAFMKTKDSFPSKIRDKKSEAILQHWLLEISHWNHSNQDNFSSFSELISRHFDFISHLNKICSTEAEIVVNGLFLLEDNAQQNWLLPKNEIINLIDELKRQQRLGERDMLIPLKRLEVALQEEEDVC